MRNSAALSQAEGTLKLNKKQNQPIWAFDIKGYTVSRPHLITTAPIARLILESTGVEKINDHNPRDQCQDSLIQTTRGSQRASLSSSRCKSFHLYVYLHSSSLTDFLNGQIHVVLPNLQELRNIVSRLAPVADDVDVSANHVCSTSLTLALPSLYFDNAAWVGMTL